MPYSQHYVHLVWSTKNRDKIIIGENKSKLLDHIITNAKIKGINIVRINCVSDHLHLLVALEPEQSISKITHLIKGESSFWWNSNNLSKAKFYWQEEYFNISVSPSSIESVINYIENQEEHHRTKSFSEEFNEFINKYFPKTINDK